jgi:asparagine synthase (glutamine-hydrolysing)
VPVGAYLSGGLDSTVNAALVQQCTSAALRTFSITFDSPEFDETAYQRQVVDALGTEHQAIRCTRQDIGQIFPEVIWHTEQPILRTAPAPLFLLSELVHDGGYKVVLTGEGADEMFGGYDIFKEAKVRRFWAAEPESAFRALLLGRLYPYLPNMRAQSLAYHKAFFHVRSEDLDNPMFSHLPRWEMTSRLKTFCTAELQAAMREHDVYADCLAMLPAEFAAWPPFCQSQFLETTTLLPGYILSSQGDRMAMAHGVEGRYPFLDHRVAEFAARVPPRLKMKGLCEKYILKRATRHIVPEAVARRTKQPYRAPDAESFFGPGGSASSVPEYVETLLSPRRIEEDGLFQPEAVERLVEKARRGNAIGFKDNMAMVGILSTQLVVEQFVRNFTPPSDRVLDAMEQKQPVGVLGPMVDADSLTISPSTATSPEGGQW